MNVLQALTENQIQAVGLLCFENERPLQGLIGKLDWKLNGAFTKLLRSGVITGEKNEMAYVPLKWNDQTFHFLILGGGSVASPGLRVQTPEEQVALFKQKASDLGLNQDRKSVV